MAAEPASLTEGTRVGGYVVEARIGVGGFGEVFRARQPVIGREVAIKILHARYAADPEAVARFVAEARAVNQIKHAGIVEIFDFGQLDDGSAYFVMELLPGRTLRDVLRERGRLPLAEALRILRGIAAAVDAGHAAGIAHRDLKPDNVFVLPDGRTKLIDFGLAKLTREQDAAITQAGSVFGTPLYMSPEQCRGKAIDTRTDLYSFGVLAYHVLTGEPPFAGDALALALHHLNDEPEPPSKRVALPPGVDRVVLELLAKDPADRPASLVAAVAAMEGAIGSRRRRSVRAGLVVATFVGAALAIGGVAWLRSRSAPVDHDVPAQDACEPAAERLAGVWDRASREDIAKRFATVAGGDVVNTWPPRAKILDDVASRWAVQWDAACHDRSSAPLLRAQRVTCLENVLLELRGFTESLSTVDAVTYLRNAGDGLPLGVRTLGDCANPDVLGAQVAAPRPEVRDRVSRLLLDIYRLDPETGEAQTYRSFETLERVAGRLDAIAHELETIDRPASAVAIKARANLIIQLAMDDGPGRLPEARAALADASRRVEAGRDEVEIADTYLDQVGFQLRVELDGDLIANATEALGRAELAVARAGNPVEATIYLDEERGSLAFERGDYEAAIAAYRTAISAAEREVTYGVAFGLRQQLVCALSRAGHDREALETATHAVELATAFYGEADSLTVEARGLAIMAKDHAGDAAGALAGLRRDRAAVRAMFSPHNIAWNRAYELELVLRAGSPDPESDPAVATATVHALAGQGTTPPLQSPDGVATVRRAGMFEAFALVADHDVADGSDQALDNGAILAFERGDDAAMTTYATAVARRCAAQHACSDWIRFSRWLAVLAEAKSGHTAKLDDRLAALEADYKGGTAAAYTGVVLASLGRWHDARVKLEAARAVPNVWARRAECDLAEVDAWLGLARIEDGDAAHARQPLEESLGVLPDWANGFSYMTPAAELALARLLATTDRPRAHLLGERARDGFARLGRFREPERQQAIRWLAEH